MRKNRIYPGISGLVLKAGMILMTCATTVAQPVVTDFTAVQSGNKVVLQFTIVTGNTCSDIEVNRSLDKLNWQMIGSIAGICGSLSESKTYTYVDEHPHLNKGNHYYIDLRILGISDTITVQVIDKDAVLLAIPNPVRESAVLYFSNDTHQEVKLHFYRSDGRESHLYSTTGSQVMLIRSDVDAGLWLVRIIYGNDDSGFTGKIIVE